MTFGQRSAASVASRSKFNRIMRSTGRKGEVKALDFPEGAASVGTFVYNLTNANPIWLNPVAVGSSFFNRVGRKIEMKSLHIHGKILARTGAAGNLNANASNTQEYVRFVVFYDRQTNGALPALTDVFQNTDNQGNNYNTVYSDINLNNRERFLILMDERRAMPAVSPAGVITPTTDSNQCKEGLWQINRFIKLKGLLTHFKADSASPVIGDVSTGGLFYAVIGESTPGAPDVSQYVTYISARLRYDDT